MAPLRFVSIAAGICLLAAPAFAQNAPEITLRLSPGQAAAIVDAMDARGRLPVMAPPASVEVADTLKGALEANPKSLSEFETAYRDIQLHDGSALAAMWNPAGCAP
jgi:hypothetical protein